MNIGLIIHGPIISTGKKSDGPNYVHNFQTIHYIEKNIAIFTKYCNKIILTIWEGETTSISHISNENVIIIECSKYPYNDNDNRRKQFYSVFQGLKYLKNNSDITHVFKIRTDQLVDDKIINWFTDEYNNSEKNQEKIFFSELNKDRPFYAGDFIIGGNIDKMYKYYQNILSHKSQDLHVCAAIDHLIKHIYSIEDYKNYFSNNYPFVFQQYINKKQLSKLWNLLLDKEVLVIPEEIFFNIKWRNKNMQDIIDRNTTSFIFYNNYLKINFSEKITFENILKEYYRYYYIQRVKRFFNK